MLIVKKFGEAAVANRERIFNVARRCIEDYKKGNDIIVVLSAMEIQQTSFWNWRRTSIRMRQNENWICF